MADPLGFLSVAGGGGELLGGLGGELFGGRDRQRRALERALAELRATNVEAGPSAYGSDVDFLGALGALRRQYEEGGMSGADRLSQAQAMNEAASRANMANQGVMQGMAQRGQLGGGAELAARLANAQAGTQAMYGAGAHAAGEAQRRALEGLRGWGSMSGTRAGASDVISRFNAAQRLARAQAVANAAAGQASYYGGEADRRQAFGAGIGRGLGSGLGYFFGPKGEPEDERPFLAPREM